MKRSEILYSLENAQVAHAQWLVYARQLLEGDDIESAQMPLQCTECTFGKWYYSEWAFIKNIPGFKEIELLHREFHEYYEVLYEFSPKAHKQRGLFGSVKEKEKQKEQLKAYYRRLDDKSKSLLKMLQQVETVVAAMSDRLFERNMNRETA